ncbi:unnamed protein product [Adineta steineri]|uniref:Annexin n=1 Tax=Adineta steineri TaxID=433720 RepID=A0A818V5B1_9BILA|nr:unnamed protein product [Adineta steineri]CAF3706226.1 unnamed protein product [Adineta steineri]
MSGYPYGNQGGGYPPQYPGDNSGYPNYPQNTGYPNYPPTTGFQPPPPQMPNYNDNQSCASLYGAPNTMPNNNNYPPAPYDSYGGNQMPNTSYGMGPGAGAGGNYCPPPPSQFPGGQMQQPMYNQPPQQYGGYDNSQYPQPPPPHAGGGMYPNMQGTPPYGGGAPSFPNQQPGFLPHEQSSMFLASLEQYQGTVFPIANFNPEADCQALGHAMKGAGTNERALIDIIANRSNVQRQQIKLHYKTMYGEDLVKKVSGELSGHFKETINALFDAPANYEAWALHEALHAGKEGAIREILLTRTNAEIRAINEAFKRIYNKDLEHEISHRIRGTDFKRILVSAVQANREELTPQQIQQARQMGIESVIDRNRAMQDADALYKAGAGKIGTDEKTFNAIFARRSYYQLRATFEEYQRKHGKDIAKVIRSEFSGDTQDAYLVLITCVRDRPSFFAERIHKAVSGLGTKDSTLIRVIVTRSEIDLAQIKQRYQQMYNRSLAHDVAGDTSGDYERVLLSILK